MLNSTVRGNGVKPDLVTSKYEVCNKLSESITIPPFFSCHIRYSNESIQIHFLKSSGEIVLLNYNYINKLVYILPGADTWY